MDEAMEGLYGSNVVAIEWWASDGHHTDVADTRFDPLEMLILEESDD